MVTVMPHTGHPEGGDRLEPQPFFPTSVETYRGTLRDLNAAAEMAERKGDRQAFDLWARLFHTVAGMCLKEHGVELRDEFVR